MAYTYFVDDELKKEHIKSYKKTYFVAALTTRSYKKAYFVVVITIRSYGKECIKDKKTAKIQKEKGRTRADLQ